MHVNTLVEEVKLPRIPTEHGAVVLVKLPASPWDHVPALPPADNQPSLPSEVVQKSPLISNPIPKKLLAGGP